MNDVFSISTISMIIDQGPPIFLIPSLIVFCSPAAWPTGSWWPPSQRPRLGKRVPPFHTKDFFNSFQRETRRKCKKQNQHWVSWDIIKANIISVNVNANFINPNKLFSHEVHQAVNNNLEACDKSWFTFLHWSMMILLHLPPTFTKVKSIISSDIKFSFLG